MRPATNSALLRCIRDAFKTSESFSARRILHSKPTISHVRSTPTLAVNAASTTTTTYFPNGARSQPGSQATPNFTSTGFSSRWNAYRKFLQRWVPNSVSNYARLREVKISDRTGLAVVLDSIQNMNVQGLAPGVFNRTMHLMRDTNVKETYFYDARIASTDLDSVVDKHYLQQVIDRLRYQNQELKNQIQDLKYEAGSVIAQLRQTIYDYELENECIICMDQQRSVVYQCGHRCVCKNCDQGLVDVQDGKKKCPQCRQVVEHCISHY